VYLAHVGQLPLVRQKSEAAPSALFGQKLAEQIRRSRWRQQQQEQRAKKLRSTPLRAPPATSVAGQGRANLLVRDKWGKRFQQSRGASRGQRHSSSTKENPCRGSRKTSIPVF
jgi:hypothetical protein